MSEHYLSGARWILTNESFKYQGTLDTNGQGDLRNIAPGTYTFMLAKEGYIPREETIVVDDKPINIQADLEKEPEEEEEEEEPAPETVEEQEPVEEEPKRRGRRGRRGRRSKKQATENTETTEDVSGTGTEENTSSNDNSSEESSNNESEQNS